MYVKLIKNFSFYFNKEKRKLLNLFSFINYVAPSEFPKISAYLSIYNDSDVLQATLNSIKDYVDELIVVDGAYEWMAPYLRANGRDPLRSDESVYQIIKASSIPFRVVSGLWKNEVEKRIAGYNATSFQFVMRVDADEVLFFEDSILGSFFGSGCAVAEMYMPNYVSPGLVIQGRRLLDKFRKFPRQACLFNKARVSASEHLRYLWLVLTADQLPHNGVDKKIYPVFEKPIAFCAHLTNWRYVESSASRSSFYTMNWMRQYGAPWIKNIPSGGLENFEEFFQYISHKDFLEVMRGGSIVQGDIQLKKTEKLSISPLTSSQEAKFAFLYKNFMKDLSKQTISMTTTGGVALTQYPFYIDVSSQEVLSKLEVDGIIRIEFSGEIELVSAEIIILQNYEPFSKTIALDALVDKNLIDISVSSLRDYEFTLRRSIRIQVTALESPCLRFKIVHKKVVLGLNELNS